MKLNKHLVEKPWGRTDVPLIFGDVEGRPIGEVWYQAPDDAGLPLLVKWLFTSEKLSIQVHPNDAQAQERGQPSGKEECWYIVDAEPDAVLGMGTIRPLSAEELRSASLSGDIETLMDWKPVRPGDYFYIPAGTVHAIGAGITLVEVQQYADITYRLYDYGRPRELHLDYGVAVSNAKPYADPRSGHAKGNIEMVEGPHFWLRHVTDTAALVAEDRPGPYWLIPLSGEIRFADESLQKGDCLIVDKLDPLKLSPSSALLAAGIATV
ncbi:MAG: class I mannose-6-phosphate isomerase [Sphingorhabdus sp.]